ncbi:MAG: hypothetical protein WKF43_01360 [Acidimicrobiales bacterium]
MPSWRTIRCADRPPRDRCDDQVFQFWFGSGDDLSHDLIRPLDLQGTATAALSLKARYEIEEGFDYLYATSASPTDPTGSSTSPTSIGCSSPTGTRRRPTTTPACTRVRG